LRWRGAARSGTAVAVLAAAGSFAGAQVPPAAPASTPAAAAVPGVAASAPRASATKPRTNGKQVTTPLWTELSAAEQRSLAPLAGTWNTLSAAQKRKWQALSPNFPKLSADEQAKLHSRMTEWAGLSPQQRSRARLNFAGTKELTGDEKKAKWEAYQALPPEEKRKLAASAASAAKPPDTAAAIKPVPQDKLAKVPKPRAPASRAVVAAPRGAASGPVLLPAGPAGATAPAAAASTAR